MEIQFRKQSVVILLAMALAVLTACGGNGTSIPNAPNSVSASSPGTFNEDWSSLPLAIAWIDAGPVGAWLARYNGFGTTQIIQTAGGRRMLEFAPKASTQPLETHASLVVSSQSFNDFDATVQMQTVTQLRSPTPNAWETAWFLWHYQDDTHFYYLILKTSGWELGKEDPLYPDAQRFLSTGSERTFAVGSLNTVSVVQQGAHISVAVNGTPLTTFEDRERPYLIGSLGLYCEDARVRFGAITVR